MERILDFICVAAVVYISQTLAVKLNENFILKQQLRSADEMNHRLCRIIHDQPYNLDRSYNAR